MPGGVPSGEAWTPPGEALPSPSNGSAVSLTRLPPGEGKGLQYGLNLSGLRLT